MLSTSDKIRIDRLWRWQTTDIHTDYERKIGGTGLATDKNENIEIEARYLVCGNGWRGLGTPIDIYQGYLSTHKEKVIRIRVEEDTALLTVKGQTVGLKRDEFETVLDDIDKARRIIEKFCEHPILKTRHKIEFEDNLWEVDEFKGKNEGLVIAEIEFTGEDQYQKLQVHGKPDWIGKEITSGYWQYTNMRLAEHPFGQWNDAEKRDMRAHAAGHATDC